MIAYDFKLDSDGDIFIDPVAMDFVIAPSDDQHKKDILNTVPGWIKEFPLVGLNPYKYLNGKINKQEVLQEVTTQLRADGYTVPAGGVTVDVLPSGELDIQLPNVYR